MIEVVKIIDIENKRSIAPLPVKTSQIPVLSLVATIWLDLNVFRL